jgi:RHS repeat-associated protein
LKSDDSAISRFDYRYDNTGARIGVTESNGDRVTWSYDKTDRLTGEQRSGANAYAITHAYDAAGNRLVQVNNGARTTYAYDAANQLSTSIDSSGTTTYTYDAAGNLTAQHAPAGRTTNTWDAENHLILVQAPSSIVNTMAYRADGLRVEKQDSSGVSRFLWDGQNILLETGSDNATRCFYTVRLLAYGNLVSQRRLTNGLWLPSYYHFDGLGSTDRLTDASQAVTDNYLYEGYGRLLIASGSTANSFRWVGLLGYFYDLDLSEYYIRARYYDPAIARWINADPIGYEGGINLYEYVGYSPLTYTDPMGLIAGGGVITLHYWAPVIGGYAYGDCTCMNLTDATSGVGLLMAKMAMSAVIQTCAETSGNIASITGSCNQPRYMNNCVNNILQGAYGKAVRCTCS